MRVCTGFACAQKLIKTPPKRPTNSGSVAAAAAVAAYAAESLQVRARTTKTITIYLHCALSLSLAKEQRKRAAHTQKEALCVPHASTHAHARTLRRRYILYLSFFANSLLLQLKTGRRAHWCKKAGELSSVLRILLRTRIRTRAVYLRTHKRSRNRVERFAVSLQRKCSSATRRFRRELSLRERTMMMMMCDPVGC